MEAEATTNRRARRPLSARLTTAMLAALAAARTGDGTLAFGFSAAPPRRIASGMPPSIRTPADARFRKGILPKSPPLLSTPRGADGDEPDDRDESQEPRRVEAPSSSEGKGLSGNKKKFNRESLRKLGVSALLAYGFVSNVCGVIAVSCAWFVFSKRTGTSPLANKPGFLAVYAGFTAMLHVIRPARFALSVSISPFFERLRSFLRRKFGVGPGGATALVVVFFNLLGSCTLMGLGVGLASALSGVPAWRVG